MCVYSLIVLTCASLCFLDEAMPILENIKEEVLMTDEVRKILRFEHCESVRRLVRNGLLKPLGKSKPYRFSKKSVLQYLNGEKNA